LKGGGKDELLFLKNADIFYGSVRGFWGVVRVGIRVRVI
jgi:hypothetical protein